MNKIIVKNFWINPKNPPVKDFYEFNFGYTNQGKDFKYSVSVNPTLKGSDKALHELYGSCLRSQDQLLLKKSENFQVVRTH